MPIIPITITWRKICWHWWGICMRIYLCVRGNVFMQWIFTRSLVSRNEITFSRAKKPRESNRRRRRVALKQDLSVSASCVNRDNVSYRYLAKNEIKTWTSFLASRIFFFNIFNQRESEKFMSYIIKVYDSLLNLYKIFFHLNSWIILIFSSYLKIRRVNNIHKQNL